MIEGVKINKKVDVEEFVRFLKEYNIKLVECTHHTFFRLSEKQRKIYTCEELKRIIFEMKPFLVGFQYNENYAAFYKYGDKNLKMIINLGDRKIKIVTFYFIEEWQIPKI